MEQIKPDFKRVLDIFYKLCEIPHGSGDLERTVEFLKRFAKDHGATATVDRANNVIIEKSGQGVPLAVQAHTDMVCECEKGKSFDFSTEPIHPILDGDRLHADGTTLGADDGVGVAMALALLESDIKNPIYLILTADEETGLLGANALSLDGLPLKTLINLDSEEEGIITIGCADGVRCDVSLNRLKKQKPAPDEPLFRLSVSGLLGGHSGTDIHKNRGNAIKILCEILEEMPKSLRLCTLLGGSRHSAIPRTAEAVFALSKNDDPNEALNAAAKKYRAQYENFSAKIAPFSAQTDEPDSAAAASFEDTQKILRLIKALPHGVVAKSRDFEGLTETSVNLAVAEFREEFHLCAMIRSNVENGSEAVAEEYKNIAESVGAKTKIEPLFPIWPFCKNSPLTQKAEAIYKTLFGIRPQVLPIHAGLECGLLRDKLPGLDCISIGPDLHNVHTANEWLSLSSAERTWQYLYTLLKTIS